MFTAQSSGPEGMSAGTQMLSAKLTCAPSVTSIGPFTKGGSKLTPSPHASSAAKLTRPTVGMRIRSTRCETRSVPGGRAPFVSAWMATPPR
jgi:hypothetical protein